MQNRYVGDIGDFGKYAMFRYLAKSGLPLGVNWYLSPDESRSGDGKLIAYLKNDQTRHYDPELFDLLKKLVNENQRDVREIEASNILAPDTSCYTHLLDWSLMPEGSSRTAYRIAWHQAALEAVRRSSLVFLDPDNGLQVKSVSLTSRKGNKYISTDELKDYILLGKSVIFYNHRERKQESLYLEKLKALLADRAFGRVRLHGIKFSGGTVRDYIFLAQPEHEQRISTACNSLLNSPWRSHFSLLPL